MTSSRLIVAAAATVAAALLCGAPAAEATARFASPGGSGTTCTQPMPCDVVTAVNKAAANDDITIEPGTYGPLAAILTDEKNTLTIHGQAGAPRPLIIAPKGGFFLSGIGTRLSDVALEDATPGAIGLASSGFGVTIERVLIHTLGSESHPCLGSLAQFTLIDSVCVADGVKSTALDFENSSTVSVTLRNDTLEALGGSGPLGGFGLIDGAFSGQTVQATLINTIVHGSNTDLLAEADVNPSSKALIVAEYSNYASDTAIPHSGTATVTPEGTGTNQSAAPLFVNTAMDDFHELAGSPTLGAGFGSPANGLLDLDGVPRQSGGVTDIGAYQFVAPPAGPPATAPITAATVPPQAPPAPSDSQPLLTPKTFAPLARGASVARTAHGTTVTYTDTQAATTVFTVRRQAGSGVLSHGRCVAPPRRRPAQGRRCTRFSTVGSFSHGDTAGANRFRFTGRIRGRALRPGSYQLVSAPTNAAGKTGATHLNALKIVAG
jgi:hypothetical protein